MKITFMLKDSSCDCKIQITDQQGIRYYYITTSHEDVTTNRYITVEIFSDEFDLMIVPITPDFNSMIEDVETRSWMDRVAKKAAKVLGEAVDKGALRVGCNYYIKGLQDGDRLDIDLQSYIFGTFAQYLWLDLPPMIFVYYEVSNFNNRYEPYNAFGINRKDVIKTYRAFAFADSFDLGLLFSLISYPILMGRIRHLSKNKKIFKTIRKFHNMSEEQRQKVLENMEKDI